MPHEGLMRAWINPLSFLEVEFQSADEPDAEAILSFLCRPGMPGGAKSLVERYRRISAGPTLFAAPNERRILDKLVWPLRHAKASYVVGDDLSVVALCGIVGEMVAVLLWRLAETERDGQTALNGQTLTQKDAEDLRRKSVEDLDQGPRVKILKRYGVISSDVANQFLAIREIRNAYLHRWSHEHDRLPKDALRCFDAAIRLVIEAIGQDVKEGKLLLNPRLLEHLEREGVFETHQDSIA